MHTFSVGGNDVEAVRIGENGQLVFIGGPCAIENLDHTLFMAEKIKLICERVGVPLIFKACYDKDCRSSPDSFHGVRRIGFRLEILQKVRSEFKIPVVSDFSVPDWAEPTGNVCDLVQVPAMSSNVYAKSRC